MSCIFCRIVAGEIPAEIVLRTEDAVAFLDITPLADGHTVVIPRTHVATLEAMTPRDVGALFAAVHAVAGPVRTAVGAEGSTIGINNGAATGQTIPHVHVHVVPRWGDDGAGSVHTIFQLGERRPIADIGRRVREAVG